jgi:hypothetical protein
LPHPDRTDGRIAVVVGILALAAYVRTLAPDVLYGDSAEFQTLAYTLGTTHSTGYPVYLLLARAVGSLPLLSPAWRINLFSALCAAATLGGLYLLTRFLTPSRIGAALGSVALGLTYTFWSQAIIAEVYAPASAFLVGILTLLAYWQRDPLARRRALACATALTCLGLGVHGLVALVGPTALLFVLWVIAAQPRLEWWPCLREAMLGFGAGITLYFLAFILLDLHDPPSSFVQVALLPSRSSWGLQAGDLDSVLERWWLTVSATQWRNLMYPVEGNIGEALGFYLDRLLDHEFSAWLLAFTLLGCTASARGAAGPRNVATAATGSLLRRILAADASTRLGVFMLATFVVTWVFVLNFYPFDRHLFYLPTYLFIAIASGIGIGSALGWTRRVTAGRRGWSRATYPLLLVACVAAVVAPHAGERARALRAGVGTFVQDTFPYPRHDLEEPRRTGMLRLQALPAGALLAMDWRSLYATYYLAHVEGLRHDVTIREATPYGSGGRIADTLLDDITAALEAGRPVLVERAYPGLAERFEVTPEGDGTLLRLMLRRD